MLLMCTPVWPWPTVLMPAVGSNPSEDTSNDVLKLFSNHVSETSYGSRSAADKYRLPNVGAVAPRGDSLGHDGPLNWKAAIITHLGLALLASLDVSGPPEDPVPLQVVNILVSPG